MTTTAATHGRYRFSHVARMEWAKLRSLRSTWWVLAVTVAGAIGIAVAVGVNTEDAAADLTNNALAGISLGLRNSRKRRRTSLKTTGGDRRSSSH